MRKIAQKFRRNLKICKGTYEILLYEQKSMDLGSDFDQILSFHCNFDHFVREAQVELHEKLEYFEYLLLEKR